MINLLKDVLGEDDVHVVRGSTKGRNGPRPIRSGIWSILNGYKPIPPTKNRAIMRSVVEIATDAAKLDESEPINIIGSSYGSVVAANTAIALLESKEVEWIEILTASMIDPGSELGEKLASLVEEGKIGSVIWDPNEGDDITAASGTSRKEARQGLKRVMLNKPSLIFGPVKHPHNKAALHKTGPYNIEDRAYDILHRTVGMGSEGTDSEVDANLYQMVRDFEKNGLDERDQSDLND